MKKWLLFFLLFPCVTNSTTVKYLTDRELTHLSDLILVGRCIQKKSYWNQSRTRIYTVYTFKVQKKLKGKVTTQYFHLKQWGGTLDGITYYISGIADYTVGERAFSFFTPANSQGFRFTVGLAQGKLTVVTSPSGREYLLRNTQGLHFQNGRRGRIEIYEYEKFEQKIKKFLAEKK